MVDCTFFSTAHGTLSRINHILGHKSSLKKSMKTEIVSSIFSDHSTQTRYQLQEKTAKNTNSWRLNNILLNNKKVTEEIKKEIKRFLETNDNENMTTQNLWDSAKAVLRGRFTAIQPYLKKQKKHSIDSLTLHLKKLEKEE